MRDELKDFNWNAHHDLKLYNYDETLKFTIELNNERELLLEHYVKNIQVTVYLESGPVLLNPEDVLCDDAKADMMFYNRMNTLYIWHFGLWRLQGIFEGILIQDFLPPARYNGLKTKLDALLKNNYHIESCDYDAILEWGKLRNAISHCPPSGQIDLQENDIVEYYDLLKRVTIELYNQKNIG